MKMNIPCRELKMVKRYAMTTVLSLTYMRPKAQVSPRRHSKAMAPITQDLKGKQHINIKEQNIRTLESAGLVSFYTKHQWC